MTATADLDILRVVCTKFNVIDQGDISSHQSIANAG